MNNLYNLKDSDNLLLYIGQHVWQKNFRLILNSLALLKKETFPFKMIFAGSGDAASEIKRMAEGLNLNDNVIFAGFIEDRDLLKSLYVRADLFIFPSIYDNAPIAVREAAVAQCPSVLLKGSNAAEIIEDGVNGFLTENTSESLAQVIKYVFSDRERLKSAGKNARLSICKPWEKVVEEVKEKYLDILTNWKGRKLKYA